MRAQIELVEGCWADRGMHTWWEYCRSALPSLTTQRTVRVVLAAAAISAGRKCVTHFLRTVNPFSKLCSSCFPAWIHESAHFQMHALVPGSSTTHDFQILSKLMARCLLRRSDEV